MYNIICPKRNKQAFCGRMTRNCTFFILPLMVHIGFKREAMSNSILAFVRCHLKRLRNMRKIGSGEIVRDMKE